MHKTIIFSSSTTNLFMVKNALQKNEHELCVCVSCHFEMGLRQLIKAFKVE